MSLDTTLLVHGKVPGMRWIRATLHGKPVYARATDDGQPAVRRGLVDVVYGLRYRKVYRAKADNLQDIDTSVVEPWPEPEPDPEERGKPTRTEQNADRTQEQVEWKAWTDGACSGNPGPAGCGVVVEGGGKRWELSEYLGQATNNVAELTAILRALEHVPKQEPLLLYTDSQYAIGVLVKGWKAKANQSLIERIKRELDGRAAVQFRYVRGHAGNPLNERADELARAAVSSRSTQETQRPLDQGKQASTTTEEASDEKR